MKYGIMITTIALSAALSGNAIAGKGGAQGQAGFDKSMEQRSEQGQTHQKAMEQRQQGMAKQKEKMKAKQSEGEDTQAMEMDKDMDQTGVTE